MKATQVALLLFNQFDHNKKMENLDLISHIFPTHIPDKGMGFIRVADEDVEKAEDLLRAHIGEFEWGYYPKEKLIKRSTDFSEVFYGKLEIENIDEYFKTLIQEGVTIYDFAFFQYEAA